MKSVPMPTGEHPFEEIAMDFVKELPDSEGYNTILVVTDRFTKVHYYIAAKTTWILEDITQSYINHIWRLYGLPRDITMNCSLQFAFKFLTEVNWKLNINPHLSTAYHPQTDRLSERAVQTLKQYLHIYCHDRPNCWRTCVPLAEFANNTTATTTHKLFQYKASMTLIHPPYT